MTPLAFLLQLKGHLCTMWTPESLGRDLVDKRICDPRPEPPWRRRPSLRQLSQLCRKGQGSGCLGSTNQKESVALPNKIALSVFGWLLLEKRRSYSLHGRLESFGNTFYKSLGLLWVILKPHFCLRQMLSLSLISGVCAWWQGGGAGATASEKTIYSIKLDP